jgi:hypothetical protein
MNFDLHAYLAKHQNRDSNGRIPILYLYYYTYVKLNQMN